MDADDIVIGSGLAALATAQGLPAARRVLVMAGPAQARIGYYDDQGRVPSHHLGLGGMGNHWHGVIAFGAPGPFKEHASEFAAYFSRYYPHALKGEPQDPAKLFVPWQPIRPAKEWPRLIAQRPGRLRLSHQTASQFQAHHGGVEVVTTDGAKLRCQRLWVAAGTLHTPKLLERSAGVGLARNTVSDHAFCYLGQLHAATAPHVHRTRDGVWFSAQHDKALTALYTLRPARFSFRRLDHGIEQRAYFGLPMGNALAKIARRASPGLLAEAFYNRFGVGAKAAVHSVYAQVCAADAYHFDPDSAALSPNLAALRQATDAARTAQPYTGLVSSQRPELHIPGIHLHHSVDPIALQQAGLNVPGSAVQVVDPSPITDLGPNHHSFRVMLSAYVQARES